MNQNIEILRARAERYRRLANELFDERTSEEAASLARELDAEIARLQMEHDSDPDRPAAPALALSSCH